MKSIKACLYLLAILCLSGLCGGGLKAAEGETNNGIGISIYSGTYVGGGEINHAYGYPDGTYNWTLSYGAGIHYRSVDFIHSTRLNFSLEMHWMDLDSDPVFDLSAEDEADYSGYALPVMLWCELMPRGVFGPFVRAGIGTMQLDLSDDYSDPYLESRSTDYWSFAFGLGAGIYYSPTDKIELILIVQGMAGTQENTFTTDSGRECKIEPYSVYIFGIDLRYWFPTREKH